MSNRLEEAFDLMVQSHTECLYLNDEASCKSFVGYKNMIFQLFEKQAERVQELEEERDEWKDTAQSYYMTNQELRGQNKRFREALIYVTKARIEQYHDFKSMLEDIKFVVNKTLEESE